ncbi:GNAT family N-acetyltransferase [Micromonospora sp. NBC_00362]|uniref:GNAT family N-acetyltransferase n=1 Tax=Micromonospora sp. NBC_00362 TaxID=2975975 RepID=UPI00225B9E7E|nr:GNAT family N-acetyltransferase [Micromonospora sp. NBC_00362]MCX5116866.1 GNAT family N-acetyltransferase [Micromonospora sp. NBC_00362]
MAKVVTYLEMNNATDLRPGKVVPELSLRRVDVGLPLVHAINGQVGAPHGWRCASRTNEEWQELMRSRPLRQYRFITLKDEIVGVANVEPHPDGEVEITAFGLMPEYVGKGLGGHALTLTIRQAWDMVALESPAVRRVWLHTCSLDHPNALRNYQRRGMTVYRTEVEAE